MAGPDHSPDPQEPHPLPNLLTTPMFQRFRVLTGDIKLELKDDDVYFQHHPDRFCRVRFPFPQEEEFLRLLEVITGDDNFPSDEQDMLVIVARTDTGAYIRRPVASTGSGFTPEVLDKMSENGDAVLTTFLGFQPINDAQDPT